ncbi:MAG TPA: asparagine synthase (glutamine-hydrolyzing) [Polyangia bacterium]|nr:asparagine synthase (glutamine-hydrolyzing) [Polyangia bacterium]
MCGIAGLFNFGGGAGRDPGLTVTVMRDAMAHRGPDDAGLWQSPDRRTVLAHRRLSIVDLSPAGHQPMSNEDGTVWITFNGEIYNHASLRPGLEAKGHRFRSRTDTEAIVHQYEETGEDCLQSLDGMFALGIWDAARERLLLARDRLGKKPLYYTVVNGCLLFASEIKGLLAHPDVVRDVDPEGLNLYLTFGNVPPPYTLFKGIKKLPAAHRLICDRLGNLTVERYWSMVPETPWPTHVDEQEAVGRVRELLTDAVRKRLMADVPVGAFLSGGVDSSANVALMSKLVDRPLQTYSVGFEGFGPEQNFHDLPYARRVAQQFKCDHHEISVTSDECRDYLPQLVYQQDEPIGDPACLPMNFLCRQARKDGVIVVLVGEGSDEVFGGYGDMAHMLNVASRRFERIRRLPRIVRAGLHRASRLLRAPAGRTDALRRARDGQPLYWGLDVVFWDSEKENLLTPDTWRRWGEDRASHSGEFLSGIYADLLRRQPRADLLQQMSVVELSNRLPELLLMRVDKLSMAHSIEARAPFLDATLLAYGLSLPSALKIRGSKGKHVLKQALRGIVPDEVLDRPKQGFRVPLPEWLRGPLANWAKHEIFESPIAGRGFFNRSFVDEMWRRHLANVQDHSFDLWCLVNLGSWYAHWIEGRKAA